VYVEGSRECIDYQEIKIQEQVQSLTVGSIPRSIVVVLEHDLVDSCKVSSTALLLAVARGAIVGAAP
jgi:DNA helicase MCM9